MVPVVRSTFHILEQLSHAGPLNLNEIANRTGVSKSTVFRVMCTLTQLGYAVRDEHRNYYVGYRVAGLVSEPARIAALRAAALPHMLRLRDEYGETVNLGHLQLDKVVYIEVVPSEYALRLHERAGVSVCVHASALGKAMLAFSPPDIVDALIRGRELAMLTRNTITGEDEIFVELRRVRERGYAVDAGETWPLGTCLGAPILDSRGNAIAAMSISGPTSRFNPRSNSPVTEALLLACGDISRRLERPQVATGTERAGAARNRRKMR